jgi:integrase
LVEDWVLAARSGDIFARQLSKGTIWEYRCVIREFTKEWFGLRTGEIDKSRAWLLMDQVEREVSITRRKRLRTAIDAVYKWGMLSGRLKGIQSIPTEGFQSHRKEEEKLPEILTLQELRQLLAFAKQTDHEWYPIWAMALFTGMRSGELYALQWDAVDFDNRMIYVHRNWSNRTEFGPTKGRCWRAVPMGDQLIQFLRELKIKSKDERFVLPRFQVWKDGAQAEVLRKFCIGTGLPSVKFHTLRACFATQLIKDGIAPAVVMKICGWKDLKTMQRYIRLAGIEVKGATDGLKILPETEVMGRVIGLFGEP